VRRPRPLGDVIALAGVEPDGLLVLSDGAYVRLIAIEQVLQPLRGRAHRALIRERLGALCARIPAGQGLQVVVEADRLDVDDALRTDWAEIELAATAAHDVDAPARGEAMRRLGYGLEQTIRRSAPAVGAVRMRWTIATRWTPARALELRRPGRSRGARSLATAAHERAAADSLAFTDRIAGELRAAGCDPRPLDGPAALASLARILNPSRPAPDPEGFAGLAQVLETTDAAAALEHRAVLLEAIAGEVELDTGPRDWLEHPDGALEAVMHLASPPAETSPWWLLYLAETPPPWRLAVHIRAGDRAKQRRSYRLRRRRLWAELRRRERDGKLITEETYEREREAAELDAELRLSGESGIYDVSAYLAIRQTDGDPDALAELTRTLARDFEGITDARLHTGAFLAEAGWVSTLPLAVDQVGARCRFAHRNIADCLPILSTSASATAGVPLGYALPGQTLERVDVFDERYRTFVTLVTGSAGSGKTVSVNALLARNLARGAVGYIIDRSSSEDEGGSTRLAGHYEQLAALIPGAQTIHFGAASRDVVINPWDVTDPAQVPAAKVKFLVALHTLLIGSAGGGGGAAQLEGLERTQLERGIGAVYARCSRTGETPRERILYEELRTLARAQVTDTEDGDASVASVLRRLAAQLHPYIDGGASAWLADRETTIPTGAPLLLCDLAGLPDELAAPVMLGLVDHIERAVAHRRAQYRAGHSSDAGPWAGRAFLAIDEAWKALMSPAAGAWLNDWARLTRHRETALFVITQHLEDFANPQGAALLRNSVLRLMFRTSHEELDYVAGALGYADEDLQTIAQLETRKGEFSTAYLDSEAHGRTQVRLYLSDLEYWTCSADPHRDQPVRHLALQEADGDAWEAMRRLVDPSWHRARADQLTEPLEAR
jgi:hypothetical protein